MSSELLSIRAERLSKCYRLGRPATAYGTLRETVTDLAMSPFRLAASLFNRDGADDRPQSVWALRDVSFAVTPGEVVGIIGRNGAGKSTLLKVLSRITEPTDGYADVYGRIGSLLEVGTGFHPELTGRENIYLNGAVLGMRRHEIVRNFDAIVAFAEVDRFIDTPVKHYSSGMYLRLAFSVAAHLEPEILVVDEVLAVGDVPFERKCLGKMEDVGRSGRTVLFVSHNMPAITRLCSRALLLDRGCLIEDGPAEAVVAAYLSRVAQSGATQQWGPDTAPGTDEVKLRSVTLTRADGQPAATVTVDEPIQIRVGYDVGVPNLTFRCSVILWSQGVCVFTSAEPVETEHPRVGQYFSTVTIPANLLNEGEYSVAVSLFRGVKYRYVAKLDVIVFHVVDPLEDAAARDAYARRFPGLVKPTLPWRLTFAEEPDIDLAYQPR